MHRVWGCRGSSDIWNQPLKRLILILYLREENSWGVLHVFEYAESAKLIPAHSASLKAHLYKNFDQMIQPFCGSCHLGYLLKNNQHFRFPEWNPCSGQLTKPDKSSLFNVAPFENTKIYQSMHNGSASNLLRDYSQWVPFAAALRDVRTI